jgi:nucleoside-diphosphate-sugar epimerase
MTTLILGCGYLGQHVARILLERGERVLGAVRGESTAARLAQMGVEPIRCDVTVSRSLEALPRVERVIWAVGYDRRGGHSARDVYVGGLDEALDRLGATAARWVQISTTGVYGRDDGAFVDETTPVDPRTDSGQACWEAERMLGVYDVNAVVLRLAGIYGPGRIIRRAALEAGEPLGGDPDHWLNLIQVEDAARFAVAALDQDTPSRLYLVADDAPSRRRAFYEEAARLLDAPPPRFLDASATRGMFGRDASNKRIDAARIKRELDMACLYPDYRAGLAGMLAPAHPVQSEGAGSM